MRIREIVNDKREYMSLLLLADEQEDMIEKYLDRGTMFVLGVNVILTTAFLVRYADKRPSPQ